LYIAGKDKTAAVGTKKYELGSIMVNERPAAEVFTHEAEKQLYMAPLQATNSVDRFVISALIRGGGRSGQLDALVHGISRALTVVDEMTNKTLLRGLGLLTRDPRAKERKKFGRTRARRGHQWRKR
jgi:small subunit ribosomal protein S9